MAGITYAFGNNKAGTSIPGADLYGQLAVGTSVQNYGANPGGITWWGPPDASTGYVIAGINSTDTQPTQFGNVGGVQFWRAAANTDQEMVNIYNYVAQGAGLAQTTSATTAYTNLLANGFWTNYTTTTTTTVAPTTTTTTAAPTTTTTTLNLGGSIAFAGNSWFTVPASADWAVGTGNFTVEWFQYQTNNGTENYAFDLGTSGNNFAVSMASGGNKVNVYMGGSKVSNASPSPSPNTNTWYHVAISRSGSLLHVYFNGTRIDSVTNTTNITDSSSTLYIATQDGTGSSNDNFPGNMTNFRFVKGTALYTGASLVVPTSPLTAVANTKLLLLASSAGTILTDSSGTGKVVSNGGTLATYSSLRPF